MNTFPPTGTVLIEPLLISCAPIGSLKLFGPSSEICRNCAPPPRPEHDVQMRLPLLKRISLSFAFACIPFFTNFPIATKNSSSLSNSPGGRQSIISNANFIIASFFLPSSSFQSTKPAVKSLLKIASSKAYSSKYVLMPCRRDFGTTVRHQAFAYRCSCTLFILNRTRFMFGSTIQ